MSGVAVGTFVGGAILQDQANDGAQGQGPPQFAQQLVEPINQQLGRVDDTNIDQFQGDRVADLTPDQLAALGMTDALVGRSDVQQGNINTAFNNFASGGNVNNNPYLEQSIQATADSANRNFARNTMPGLTNNSIVNGGVGGSRQGIAQGLAASDLSRQLIDSEAGVRTDQRNFDLNQQLSALTNQSSILSGQGTGQNMLLRSGGIQQQQNQAEIGGVQDLFNEEQNQQFDRDQELLRILTGGPAGATTPAPYTNPLLAGLGTATAFQGLFPGQQAQQPAAQQPVPLPAGVSPTPGNNVRTPF